MVLLLAIKCSFNALKNSDSTRNQLRVGPY